MITKLLNEVNEKIETLNNLVQDKEYFEKLDERIEKVNNYVQEQKQEIERLNKERNKTYENGLNYFLELKEKSQEIERLNNIIKRYDKFIRRRLELEGYSDTFIKHQMRELKTPDYNDLLNTGE